ncbi:MAG TPA: family 78 glycoside hydrolase catalytic domain, partial [Candidatus Lokiarchaeia archaeon]|nr:family 78 glycoside hydrolase catalytic domain [Candidatus Lokiarchaeia archaeon]
VVKYIAKGQPHERYEPFFAFHGFRYVKIESPHIALFPENFQGWAIYSQMPIKSLFECSNSLLNRFHQNVTWSQRSNFVEIPTDCPHREKMGWTGDIQIYTPTAGLNMQIGGFITKWLLDLASEQRLDGAIPPVVPEATYKDQPWFVRSGTAGWSDAGILVPWALYLLNGDTNILQKLYPVMQKWHAYVEKRAKNFIWRKGFQWGDWLEVGRGFVKSAIFTKNDWVATAYFAHITLVLSRIAELLGYSEDAVRLQELRQKIEHAYQDRFIDENGKHHPHKQGAYILGLQLGLFPEHLQSQALENLLNLLYEKNDHLATGFLSTPYFLEVLSQNGALDEAYRLLLQETYPSWLYEVKMGATTIWETWNAIKPDHTVIRMSQNHYAFGAVDRWLFNTIAGIAASSPGFKTIRINPRPGGGISWCKSQVTSLYGEIRSEWHLESGGLDVQVTIPPNSTAEIVIPKTTLIDQKQWQTLFLNHEEIIEVKPGEKELLLIVGSGEYHLFIPL